MRRSIIPTFLILFFLVNPFGHQSVKQQLATNYICGSLEISTQPTADPDPFAQNIGTGPTFKPFGWPDPSQWLEIHPLGVYNQSSGNYEFLDFPGEVNIKLWDPQLSGNTIYQISGYELVDTCGPIVSFYADKEGLTAGECTNIYWQVDNVANLEGVYFNENYVDAYSAAQVCPLESTHYQLQVRSYDGWSTDYWLRIYVADAPTPLPPIEIPYQPPTDIPVIVSPAPSGVTEVAVPAILQLFSPGDTTSIGRLDTGMYDCLAASTAMVLQALQNQGRLSASVNVDYATVRRAFRQIRPDPASNLGNDDAEKVTDQLTNGVVQARMYTVPFDQWKAFLTAEIGANNPVIITILNWHLLAAGWGGTYAHSVVAYGFHDDTVYYVDPQDGTRYHQSSADFVSAWSNGGSNLFLIHFK